jgi:transcription initiation factor TFIIB
MPCNLCKSILIITDPESGERICNNCGIVISDEIEETIQEYRIYTAEKIYDNSRTGPPSSLTRHDMGLSTTIGMSNKDANGQVLDAFMRSEIERLRLWNSRLQVYNAKDRNLKRAFSELYALKDKLGLSDAMLEKSAYIYRKAQEQRLIGGRTISGLLAAAVYIACREMGTPKTLRDIAATSNVKRKDVAKNFRVLIWELDIKIPLVDPMKCVARIANRLNLSEKTKRQAVNIMAEIVKREINTGKEPMGLAGTVVYISCKNAGEFRSQSDIAKEAGVTEVTIGSRLKDLRKRLDFN